MARISRRSLNRTTLHRQELLERSKRTPAQILESLVGMQAQNPHDPYWGLWSRIDDFRAEHLSELISRREAVRGQLLRATIHLATREDFLVLRPQLQTVCARTLGSTAFAKDTVNVDRETLLSVGRSLLEADPMTRAEMGPSLERLWPGVPAGSLAQVVTYLLPVIQVTPRGLWGQSGPAAWTTIEKWVGENLAPEPRLEDTVRRYLGAFGPASVADMRAWSSLPGLRDVVAGMRDQLNVLEGEDGAELLDLPHLPVVDEDVPAPPRFLPEYDNVLLGHSERSRFFVDDVIPRGWAGNLLVDGVFSGAWKLGKKRPLDLEIDLMRFIPKPELDAVVEEGERLLAFASPDSTRKNLIVRRSG